MFLDLEDFIDHFLCSAETVGLITYDKPETLEPFLSRLKNVFSEKQLEISTTDVSEYGHDEFCKKIADTLNLSDCQNLFLLLSGLEPLLPGSGTVLNGFREGSTIPRK